LQHENLGKALSIIRNKKRRINDAPFLLSLQYCSVKNNTCRDKQIEIPQSWTQ